MTKAIYFIGGPADLTKVAVRDYPPIYRVPYFKDSTLHNLTEVVPFQVEYNFAEYKRYNDTPLGAVYVYQP